MGKQRDSDLVKGQAAAEGVTQRGEDEEIPELTPEEKKMVYDRIWDRVR